MIKNAPIKVMKIMLDSFVGQNKIERGTQASGGIGLIISNTGKTRFRKVVLDPKNKPNGIPKT